MVALFFLLFVGLELKHYVADYFLQPGWMLAGKGDFRQPGGYAHAAGLSVAIGYVPKEIADIETGWSIELLGEMLPARLQAEPLFDPSGARMRG